MKLQRKQEREFAFVFAALLAIVGLLPLLRGDRPQGIVLSAAVLLAAVGLLRPGALAGPARWWMALAALLNRVSSAIILTIIYFVVLTPTGFYRRLTRKDALQRALDRRAATYWTDREEPSPRADTLRRQY